MATINYYLDKPNKKGLSPIHLRINYDNTQIKVSTSISIEKVNFDKVKQLVKQSANDYYRLNHYLTYLKVRADQLLINSKQKIISKSRIKKILTEYVKNYKKDNKLNIVEEQLTLYSTGFTFIDLFAGAGGFSEGFLQSEIYNKHYDFVLANDINENCELTHLVRYNHQLKLDMEFLKQDITEPDFIDNLLQKIGERNIDVICGGPPCQSFSLAGKRKKFDKKDDLFSHYLNVIKTLQPKYFVMENVKGILTKEKGKIKERILNEINSIIDIKEIPKLTKFIHSLKSKHDDFIVDCIIKRIKIEQVTKTNEHEAKYNYIKAVENKFKKLTPKIVNYKTSKSDPRINTIRHGLNLLVNNKQWENLKRDIIKEKDNCNIDCDNFVDAFNMFLTELGSKNIIQKIEVAFDELNVIVEYRQDCDEIIQALKIYSYGFDECISYIRTLCDRNKKKELFDIIESIRLYKIEEPFVLNASNYGVPQNRERVLFVGCRKDQKFISDIPSAIDEKSKVSIFEALYDLDFIGNNQEANFYCDINLTEQYNGTAESLKKLIKNRDSSSKIKSTSSKESKTYAEWSKQGRLNGRFKHSSKPFYVKSHLALKNGEKDYDILHNHKTSNQNKDVVKRLDIILKSGDYKKAQANLVKVGLSSNKRNYNVLKVDKQSPTVMTIPDDYIHYNCPRALTVREMARLQSFDDSFVFQGKRSTGGNKRKTEVPQFTLVGNAIPPLLARAVATEILKNIR